MQNRKSFVSLAALLTVSSMTIVGCALRPYDFGGRVSADASTDSDSTTCSSRCNNQCVDTATDPSHCGACGNACQGTTNGRPVCMNSACGIQCNSGFVLNNGMCVSSPAPRPVAPLSTASVSTTRPTLSWALPAGVMAAQIEICRDRACVLSEQTFMVTGTSGQVPMALSVGPHFWRLKSVSSGTVGTAMSPTWEFFVRPRMTAGAPFGSILDLNGDGRPEIVAGAQQFNSNVGRAVLWMNGASGYDNGTVIPAPASNSLFGNSVGSAGDLDGDGFPELMVTSYTNSTTSQIHLYRGSATGINVASRQLVTAALAARGIFVFLFAPMAVGVGDINGDGYGDVLVSSPGAASDMGVVDVYLGSVLGLPTARSASIAAPAGGPGGFGWNIIPVGDLNGDGRAEVVVSALNPQSNLGKVYWFRGSADGLEATPYAETTSTAAPNAFGLGLANAGDINGDGRQDVLVSGFSAANALTVSLYLSTAGTPPTMSSQTITVGNNIYLPSFSMGTLGDVNGDGLDDFGVADGSANDGSVTGVGVLRLYNGTTMTGTISPSMIYGARTMGSLFAGSQHGVGDANGDGVDDFVVGEPGGAAQSGQVRVFSGLNGFPISGSGMVLGRPATSPMEFLGQSVY